MRPPLRPPPVLEQPLQTIEAADTGGRRLAEPGDNPQDDVASVATVETMPGSDDEFDAAALVTRAAFPVAVGDDEEAEEADFPDAASSP